jgi:hypothetical protein
VSAGVGFVSVLLDIPHLGTLSLFCTRKRRRTGLESKGLLNRTTFKNIVQVDVVLGNRQKKSDEDRPHTQQSIENLIELYEAWGKPEEAEKWRAELSQTEAKIE